MYTYYVYTYVSVCMHTYIMITRAYSYVTVALLVFFKTLDVDWRS